MQPSEITWWDKYGLLGVGIFVFGTVIGYLFKLLIGAQNARVAQCDAEKKERAAEKEAWSLERQKWVNEREAWDNEREKARQLQEVELARARADFETKRAELSERMGKEIRELYKAAQDREDEIRREYSELAEATSANNVRGSEAMASAVQKIYEKLASPKGTRRY